ncbi:hypothetical protein BO70DRAFT_414391, partial [Aspergillus heteromorphus CBS 117.55]
VKNLAALDFPAYGSLYFADAPIDSSLKIPFEHGQGFCVGPNCSPVFWNRNPGELELYGDGDSSSNCGPWEDLTEYCSGLIYTGFTRLPKASAIDHKLHPHQGSVDDHIRLLRTSQKVILRLIEDARIQTAATPTLLHPDFHKRNIHVSAEDPTIITGLIDRQSSSIEPAFIYTNEIPDFAALFETVQRLKSWLRTSMNTNSDGWVPSEVFGAAQEAHRVAYEEWIQTARESEARGGGGGGVTV